MEKNDTAFFIVIAEVGIVIVLCLLILSRTPFKHSEAKPTEILTITPTEQPTSTPSPTATPTPSTTPKPISAMPSEVKNCGNYGIIFKGKVVRMEKIEGSDEE